MFFETQFHNLELVRASVLLQIKSKYTVTQITPAIILSVVGILAFILIISV